MVIPRRAAIFLLIFGLWAGLAHVARAEDAAASSAVRELKSLQRWGAANKACDGWTDGCALCARRADGSLGCSRLGVDCQVEEIQCTQKARDPKTNKTPPPQ